MAERVLRSGAPSRRADFLPIVVKPSLTGRPAARLFQPTGPAERASKVADCHIG